MFARVLQSCYSIVGQLEGTYNKECEEKFEVGTSKVVKDGQLEEKNGEVLVGHQGLACN